MIKIDLQLFVTLSRYFPEDSDCLELPENIRVKKLIVDLGIEQGSVKLIFVNGEKQDGRYVLENCDILSLFPLFGGG